MSDLENQEFRECAEQMYRGEFGLVNTDDLLIDLLARAMRIASEETCNWWYQSVVDSRKSYTMGPKGKKSVASRISSRIKGEKS